MHGLVLPRLSRNAADVLGTAAPPLLFGVKMWISVCLALYLAFWLQLDNPYWAGSAAVIACQPQLGASLRKAWFLMIGTVIGATMAVVLTGLFPQDRVPFFVLMALWCGVCGAAATVLRNFASYGAALSGYTVTLIAASVFGATGGPTPDVFLIAVYRATEICLGIACASIVLAGTDFGHAQKQLAVAFAGLAADVACGFTRMLALAGSQPAEAQAERRELVARVVALDPVVDQAYGESTHIRFRAATLQGAIEGLLRALIGWRGVETHLNHAKDASQGADRILRGIPPELRSARDPGTRARWMADPMRVRHACAKAVSALLAFPARTPSLRLLADESARVMAGMVNALDGLALLTNAPDRVRSDAHGAPERIADWLPALVSGARAFAAIGFVELLWVVTAWPNGGFAIVFAAVILLLLSPRGDLAYLASIAAAIGAVMAVASAATIKFAVLPLLHTFEGFSLALALYYIPIGFGLAYSQKPAAVGLFTVMSVLFLLVLQPNNVMTYDTSQYYNLAVAVIVGCTVAPLAFRLWPMVPPAVRERRLLALTLRDLRRLAVSRHPPEANTWEGLIYSRLVALPDQTEPLPRAWIVAALSLGSEIIGLRGTLPEFPPEMEAALTAFAQGSSTAALARLQELDQRLSMIPESAPQFTTALATRSRALFLREAITRHAEYFDTGAVA